MSEHVYCGSAPCGEDQVQVSQTFDYMPWMRKEALLYKRALLANFPPPEESCILRIITERHDFGSYLEVVAIHPERIFDEERSEKIAEWLSNVENGLQKWTDCKDHSIGNEALALMFDYANAVRISES